jgi:hypothetical protein
MPQRMCGFDTTKRDGASSRSRTIGLKKDCGFSAVSWPWFALERLIRLHNPTVALHTSLRVARSVLTTATGTWA